jgi:hypothetical protein
MARRAPAKRSGGVPAGRTGTTRETRQAALTGGLTARCGTLPVSVRRNESKDRVEARVSPIKDPRRPAKIAAAPGPCCGACQVLAYSAVRVATGSMGRRDGTEDGSGRLRAEKI